MFHDELEFLISQDLPEANIVDFLRTISLFPFELNAIQERCNRDLESQQNFFDLMFQYLVVNECWLHNLCTRNKAVIHRALFKTLENNAEFWQKAEFYKRRLNFLSGEIDF